jgi:hypothetical protein
MFGSRKPSPADYEGALILIEEAEHLMNQGGRHWGKGFYKALRWITKTGNTTDKRLAVSDSKEACYCTLGGLNEAARRHPEAKKSLALAKKMVASMIAATEITKVKSGYYSGGKNANDVIISFNDNYKTRWMDVRTVLRKAATRAAAGAAGKKITIPKEKAKQTAKVETYNGKKYGDFWGGY